VSDLSPDDLPDAAVISIQTRDGAFVAWLHWAFEEGAEPDGEGTGPTVEAAVRAAINAADLADETAVPASPADVYLQRTADAMAEHERAGRERRQAGG
jgi:hypothetical protein